ncbi:MAG: hypothetical protein Q7I99_08855, partial [Acholeplasmataceae bacterium]|nr:hypothetical protein [Acholeplasmataceae bacterium]
FIQNFKYDNLIDWNKFQRNYKDELMKSTVETSAFLSFVNEETQEMDHIGEVKLKYENQQFIVFGKLNEVINLSEITNPTITIRRDFAFYYQNKNYLFKLEHYGAAFLRIAQDKY